MADNVSITPGSGNTVAADEVLDGTLGTVKVQYVKLMDGTIDGTAKALVDSNGLKVNGSGVTQPVSGPLTDTQLRATPVPISGTVTATGPLTDTQLRATPVPVSGTVTATGPLTDTQLRATPVPVSGTVTATGPLTDTQLRATPVPISGTVTATPTGTQDVNIVSTISVPVTGPLTDTQLRTTPVPISGSLTNISGTISLPTGASTESTLSTLNGKFVSGTDIGDVTINNNSPLVVTAVGATGAAVTATLPAVASNFHYITLIEITKYFTAANAASATPLTVTTTNLPGSLAYTFGQPLGTIGTTFDRANIFNAPLKSSVVNTASTIVCPATTGIIWRVNVYYFTAP